MKINWGALGLTIAVLFLAISILTVGLVIERKISRLEQQIAIVKTGIKKDIIAQGYVFTKANSEKRAAIFEDLRDGYVLAEKFIEQ